MRINNPSETPPIRKRLSNHLRNNPWLSAIAALLVIKVWLLVMGRDQLVQEHWRNMPEVRDAWRQILVGVLLGLSILVPTWKGTALQLGRMGKAVLMGFVAIMALLMPQLLWRNYPHTLMASPLSLWDMRHYLMVDLFFDFPFLAFLLAALGAGWFVSHRKSDDRIFLTALAVCLSFVYLSLAFKYKHNVPTYAVGLLSVFFVLGIVGLFGGGQRRMCRGTGWIWFGAVVLGLALGLEKIDPLPLGFAAAYVVLAFVFSWVLRRTLSPVRPVGLFLSLFWVYAFFIAINIGYSNSPNYSGLVRYGLLMGQYLADDILLLAGGWLLLRRFGRAGLSVFTFAMLVYLAAAYVDVNYYKESGRRLAGFMLEMGGGTGMAVEMVSAYFTPLFFLGFASLALLALAGPVSAFTAGDDGWRTGRKTGLKWLAGAVVFLLAVGLWGRQDTFSGSVPRNMLAASGFFRSLRFPMVPQEELMAGLKRVGIPLEFPEAAQPAAQPPNLVLVIMESMSNKNLSLFGAGDETQPLLREYVDRMVRYPNIYCNWPSSNHARTTIWSGLYPVRTFLTKLNPGIARSSLTEILSEKGYYNAVFYSSDRNYTRLYDFMGHRGIDLFEDAQSMGQGLDEDHHVSWGVREDVTLEKMKGFLARRSQTGQPFSMTYIPACPHMPYDTIDERFQTFEDGHGRVDGNYTGAYKNELLYMDWILHSLLAYLDERGLSDNTLVAMVNDHAEFVDIARGGLGHGWTSIPPATNIPIIILPPGETGGKINPAIGSQVDVLPTLLDYLGIPAPGDMPMQGRSLRDMKGDVHRRIYLGSYQDFSVIDGGFFYNFPGNDATKMRCHAIANEDAATLYVKQEKPPLDAERLKADYEAFSRLQESLLRHYGRYDWKQ